MQWLAKRQKNLVKALDAMKEGTHIRKGYKLLDVSAPTLYNSPSPIITAIQNGILAAIQNGISTAIQNGIFTVDSK